MLKIGNKPSKYQLDIFDAYRNTNKNIVVQACPGSGKTTTILQLLNYTPSYRKVILLAFNKSIVEELNEKINKPNVKISTLHSIGLGILRNKYGGNIQVVENKNFRLIQSLKKEWGIEDKDKTWGQTIYIISKLIDYVKLHNLKGTREDFEQLSDRYAILYSDTQLDKVLRYWKYLKKYNSRNPNWKDKLLIDYSDMIYLPLQDNIYNNVYDDIFVDEVQDLNTCQQQLVDKLLSKKGGRIIAVGDKYQSIYSFMGADIDGFNKFANKENTICLPLSVSYRCPISICKHANDIYNNIEPSETAIEGIVEEEGTYKDAIDGDFVLCRNNFPLIQLYLQLLKEGKKATIKDKDLGTQLMSIIDTIPSNIEKEKGIQILKQKTLALSEELQNRGVKNVSKHPKFISFVEKIEIIVELVEHYNTFENLRDKLFDIYEESGRGINLMTIHKSKGLETDNVFILRPELIPSKYAEKEWEVEQEKNLKYVMVTRAKKKLNYIGDF